MRVIGIGLNKTGTTSLGKALENLGYKDHISFDWPATKQWSEGNIQPVLEKAKDYNNFEDWPWPMLYKELYDEFEDSKFILTKRATPEEWYDSLCRHAVSTGPTEFRKTIYGYYMPHDFKEEHLKFYNDHNDRVIKFFDKHAPEKLLVISFSDGNNWEKICDFLGKDIPKVEFPFLNSSSNADRASTVQITIKNRFLVRLIHAGARLKSLFS